MITSHLLKNDVILFDKRKGRLGVIAPNTNKLKDKTVTIIWDDGQSEKINCQTSSAKHLKRYKAIRVKDFPVFTTNREELTQVPSRIRKDEYLIDGNICKFTRLLDVLAFYELNQSIIKTYICDYLPNPASEIVVSNKQIYLFQDLFKNISPDDFSIDVCLDRTNHSFYRIKISTSILLN